MPNRVIMTEQQENPTQEQNNSQTVAQQKPIPTFQNSEVLIKSADLEKLFLEWSITGKNDLMVDHSIGEKISEWLEWQEEITPLKVRLAEKQFERFMETKAYEGTDCVFYVNGELVMECKFYSISGCYSVIHFSNFRSILATLKNPFAYYAFRTGDQNENKIINLRGWVLEHGGQFSYDDSYDKVYITFA